ncbi:MAG: hypothetical protein H6732_07900 [Alphaproteobacteria bacterium]|nr:hypothetical protein [Alphaproteobacteria bacterium]
MTEGAGQAQASTLVRRVAGTLLLVLGAVMLLRWGQLLSAYLDDLVLFVNENTLRDYEVYGRFRRGLLPLQGPITSIGGNHGWLAAWIYGAAVMLVPEAETPMLVSLGAVVVGWIVGIALAWRHAPGVPTLLAALLIPATHLPLLLCFPSHISFILVGVSLTFLGVSRAREHAGWAVVATLGVAVAIGAHRTGWGVLAALIVIDWRLGLGILRRPVAWIPLGLYLVPELLVLSFGGAPTEVTDGRAAEYVTLIAPWNVLRAIPFASPPTSELEPLQVVQLVLVLAVLALARRGLHTPVTRALWWFYVVGALVLLCFPEDEQYYIPLLAVLPALLAVATQVVAARGTAALAAWCAAVLAVFGASHAEATVDLREQFGEEEGIRSILPELAVVEALERHGITRPELWNRTIHTLVNPARGVSYLVVLLVELDHEAPPTPRCFRIDRQTNVEGQAGWEAVGPTWALKVTEEDPCPGTVARYDSPIWYLDLRTWSFVAR